MMGRPKISLFGTAHRPQNWLDLYRSIGDNGIEFEIIFVGPNTPKFQLPHNFKFIQSYTKPAQCSEIASRNTTADLIMNIADDVEFRTKAPLDLLYDKYKSHGNEKLILSCKYMLSGKDRSDMAHHFFYGNNDSPVMPLCGLMSKKLYRDTGGIDRNFIAVMWDLDIAMRVLVQGGNVLLSDVYVDEIKGKSGGSNLCNEFWNHDRKYLEDLWSKDHKIHFDRARPVEPFSDTRILEESQGPRGRWRGASPFIVEKLVDLVRQPLAFVKEFMRLSYWIVKNPKRFPEYAKRAYVAMRNPAKYADYAHFVFRRPYFSRMKNDVR